MHLSRIVLDPRNRQVMRDLGDCSQLHRTVMSAFPQAGEGKAARDAFGVLHRVDWISDREAPVLLVQSLMAPNWASLPSDYTHPEEVIQSKEIGSQYQSLVSGQRLAFRLRANPTHKVGTTTKAERLAGRKDNGRREAIPEGEREAWLVRKAETSGFQLLHLSCHPDPLLRGGDATGRRSGGKKLTFNAALFEGILAVSDPALFAETLRDGIGPAKAYGFGLVSVALPGEGAER